MNKTLQALMENVNLLEVAKTYGTPCYVYSKKTIVDNFKNYQKGFGDIKHLICFSVKSNSNLSILKILDDCGAGFDIVSGGELSRLLAINVNPQKIVFSGVGKTQAEIELALKSKILSFNVESLQELERIENTAKNLNIKTNISIRINPDIDAKTHPYISTGLKENKFGIAIDEAIEIYQKISKSDFLNIRGVNCHIGSQLTELEPFADAIKKVLEVVKQLEKLNIKLKQFDFGGGLGINCRDDKAPKPQELTQLIAKLCAGRDETIIIEPGRSIVGEAGVLLTKVEYLKSNGQKNFCVVDAAMNDLIRPSLYQAYKEIVCLHENKELPTKTFDVVGPICETGDFLGKDRDLKVKVNDILMIKDSGAYGFVMSSNYNTRGKSCEVLIDDNKHNLIRERESIASLFENELGLLLK